MTTLQICRRCAVAATGAETEPKCRVCGTHYKERIMESRVELQYMRGRLGRIIMHRPLGVCVQDLREGADPFVAIDADDGEVSCKLVLDPKIAESLTKELLKLFPKAAESVGVQFALAPLAACDNIAEYLSGESGCLTTAEGLALEVLIQSCRAEREREEAHEKLVEARS